MCGLIGFNGKSEYVPSNIKMLFLYNQDRGTDSAGIAERHNDTMMITKVVGKASLDLVPSYDFRPSTLMIGHTRAATYGVKTIDNAHPFLFENKRRVIGAHNGTLKNLFAMREHYKYTYQDIDVDSQIFFKTIADQEELSFNVLGEGEGGCAILFNIDDSNILYAYHNTERPLFRGSREEGIYFSSVMESLQAIGCSKVKPLTENTLYICKDGRIEKVLKIKENPLKYSYPRQHNTEISPVTNSDRYVECAFGETWYVDSGIINVSNFEKFRKVGTTRVYDYSTKEREFKETNILSKLSIALKDHKTLFQNTNTVKNSGPVLYGLTGEYFFSNTFNCKFSISTTWTQEVLTNSYMTSFLDAVNILKSADIIADSIYEGTHGLTHLVCKKTSRWIGSIDYTLHNTGRSNAVLWLTQEEADIIKAKHRMNISDITKREPSYGDFDDCTTCNNSYQCDECPVIKKLVGSQICDMCGHGIGSKECKECDFVEEKDNATKSHQLVCAYKNEASIVEDEDEDIAFSDLELKISYLSDELEYDDDMLFCKNLNIITEALSICHDGNPEVINAIDNITRIQEVIADYTEAVKDMIELVESKAYRLVPAYTDAFKELSDKVWAAVSINETQEIK